MKIDEGFLAKMREAAQLLKTAGPMAATAAIRHALTGDSAPGSAIPQPGWTGFLPKQPELRDITPPHVPDAESQQQAIPDALARLRKLSSGKWANALAGQTFEDVEVNETADLAGNGRYLSGACTNHAGTRAYKLYVPSGYRGEPLPLVVMLHGCTQHPDDFAAGTGMNTVAENNNCFVVYPAQTQAANASNCWNWFDAGHQQRGQGEPSIIADITRAIVSEYKIDTGRIYVAGLSAGGAMATVMGATYPELYAAVGIHSGVPYAVAHDVPSAFAAMKHRKGKAAAHAATTKAPPLGHTMPVIVFHGDRDGTVHPRNGDQVVAQCVPTLGATPGREANIKVETRTVPNGRAFTKTILHDEQGKAIAEKWIVHGAGHAWSGGSGKGSYTDPQGPDAAREMLRFFYTHAKQAG